MILLIDQGNSSLKWCLYENAIFSQYQRGELSDFEEFIVEKSGTIDEVMLSTVADKQAVVAISNILNKHIALDINTAKTTSHYHQLKNGYQKPQQLGVDRWLAMIALWQELENGFIVIDAGSALTLDIVAPDGQHLGGHIIPGLLMQKQSLLSGTDRITVSGEITDSVYSLGTSTSVAVQVGCLTNLICYITDMFHRHASSDSLPLVITGGDAPTISTLLSVPHRSLPDLVLKGLYYSFYR